MKSYQFISTLFSTVLSKSKSIEGRFYLCPKSGNEIDSDLLNEVLKQVNVPKKYPLALMMPPRLTGDLKLSPAYFVSYNITIFFLQTTFYGANNVVSGYTNTSVKTIQQDWADMQVAAVSFINALRRVEKRNAYQDFRIVDRIIPIQPISEVGVDRASGVRIDFGFQVPYGCEPLEDYNENDIQLINVPS